MTGPVFEPPPARAEEVIDHGLLDDRFAVVGTSGSGKTYAVKGLVERLLALQARVCCIDPLGVWWGLRSNRAGNGPGYPVVVFGGAYADVPITDASGAAVGRVVGTHQIACVIDLSRLGSGAALRRFMTAFAEAVYEANTAPLHLVIDEADLFAPQQARPESRVLLGLIDEIVRRGRVRGFIPWLITQRPAVLNKDVLSMADVLVAMKLTSSQDRAAMGGWIEGQADRAVGKGILARLPRLQQGEGYLWAPGESLLKQVRFPPIQTFDSSRTPKRGEAVPMPTSLAPVDISAIVGALQLPAATLTRPKAAAALLAARAGLSAPDATLRAVRTLEPTPDLAPRVAELERELADERATTVALRERLSAIAALAGAERALEAPAVAPAQRAPRAAPAERPASPTETGPAGLHPAGRKLLAALAQHAPGRFTWGQASALAGLKPSGGHFNAGRKDLRDRNYVAEDAGLVACTPVGLDAAGEVPPAPSTSIERVAMWCARLPSPAPDILRALVAHGDRFTPAAALAAELGKKPAGGHWNSGVAMLRNNGLIEVSGRDMRACELLRRQA